MLTALLGFAANALPARQIIVRESTSGISPDHPGVVPAQLLGMRYSNWSADDRAVASQAWLDHFTAWAAERGQKGLSGKCGRGDEEGLILGDSYGNAADGSVTAFDRAVLLPQAVLGSVVSQEPAFHAALEIPVTIVTLRIEQVLRDSASQLSAGRLIRYVRREGTFNFGGVVLCSYLGQERMKPSPPPSFSNAASTRTLVLGKLSAANPDLLEVTPWDELIVVEGSIHYPARIRQFPDQPMPLAELVDLLATIR